MQMHFSEEPTILFLSSVAAGSVLQIAGYCNQIYRRLQRQDLLLDPGVIRARQVAGTRASGQG
jgi:hypothetical protein